MPAAIVCNPFHRALLDAIEFAPSGLACRGYPKKQYLYHVKYCLLPILLVLGTLALTKAQQPDSLRFQGAIPAMALFATSDNLSNTYLVSPENAIVKYDTLGRKVAMFTSKRLGQAAFIDASNPLKILVWYPDFQTVLWLDRTLTEMGRLNLSSLGYYSVRCVAMAFDGNIWAFDDAVSRAVKLRLDGSLLFESPPLNIYFPKRFSATRIRDSGQYVCLSDTNAGLCTLDQYANLQDVHSDMRIHDFDMEGAWLFYLGNKQLYLQNMGQLLRLEIPLPKGMAAKGAAVWLGKHCVYWQNGAQLEQYGWE